MKEEKAMSKNGKRAIIIVPVALVIAFFLIYLKDKGIVNGFALLAFLVALISLKYFLEWFDNRK